MVGLTTSPRPWNDFVAYVKLLIPGWVKILTMWLSYIVKVGGVG